MIRDGIYHPNGGLPYDTFQSRKDAYIYTDYEMREAREKIAAQYRKKIEELEELLKGERSANSLLNKRVAKMEDEIDVLKTVEEDQNQRIETLEKKMNEVLRLVDEDREMINIMWNAACMPGGQEAAEMAKVHWEELANGE